ncbi:Putative molybdenum carrier [Desulfopila aestuarii DSM 18488]|uniref:Putative molybdenum carrier n=2 Tax=Desulfopila aestuarii TaxID=231440 RepID=A0A1M7YBJ5_9BACT|nr:Putative molybdenum carrier [Desulfopila aestuarii DSM 18488]
MPLGDGTQYMFIVSKIVSGGQTGADRAALDGARDMGCPYGGWLPKGRKTEDGSLHSCYLLREMLSASYQERTEQNVIDSDGTLICSHGKLTGGSLLTQRYAKKHHRPCLHVDFDTLSSEEALTAVAEWIIQNTIGVLNVAGPRASGDPAIYNAVKTLITELLRLSAAHV